MTFLSLMFYEFFFTPCIVFCLFDLPLLFTKFLLDVCEFYNFYEFYGFFFMDCYNFILLEFGEFSRNLQSFYGLFLPPEFFSGFCPNVLSRLDFYIFAILVAVLCALNVIFVIVYDLGV